MPVLARKNDQFNLFFFRLSGMNSVHFSGLQVFYGHFRACRQGPEGLLRKSEKLFNIRYPIRLARTA